MTKGQPNQPRHLAGIHRADSTACEFTPRQLRAALFVIAALGLVNRVVPEDCLSDQPAVALAKIVHLLQLLEAVIEVPLVVIVPVRLGIGGARLELGIDQAFVIAWHPHKLEQGA